ncbi:hypothetical protein NX722_24280 [Endozoicomonas gorgoniicola]|uniref:TubC N-terminal docking domain-containing protein n=1 Tax=Endozoicomonas gorgoniicola TaxID=1234144 RepID=A0ABT3N2W6_9GAMM|nr:hypothetical protein [Endozoicomonas gorgoniicola]MCW7555688.1 hypothetical protein [Endozoicomonas gorgoniicola]
MTPTQLLTYLELMGVEISVGENGQLNVVGSSSILDTTTVARLKASKIELLKVLSGQSFDARRVKDTLQFVCRGLVVTPEILIRYYFTPDDLEDIRAGQYPDLVALRKLILSDPDYPFLNDESMAGKSYE